MTSKWRWALLGLCCLPVWGAELHLDRIKLPPGFRIEVYAQQVKNAREMVLGPGGTLFVSTRREGNVYALLDSRRQNRADRVITLAKGLQNPNGVAFRDGALYVAERSRVLRYDDIERHLDRPPRPVVVRGDFPTEAHHGWKFIAFGPDGWLYVPVGAPCNVCKSEDPIFATITRVSADGKQREIYAQRGPQHGRLRLAPADARPLVHRQRPRRDGRGHAARRAEPRADRRSGLRLPRLSRQRHRRSGVRSRQGLRTDRRAGGESAGARGRARDALLHGLDVPGGVPQRHLHRRARLLEPHHSRRLRPRSGSGWTATRWSRRRSSPAAG